MKILILLFAFIFSSSVLAQHHGHKHTSLSSHEHGFVKLAIAIEGKTLDIELDGPSESILGFEHQAVSKNDLLIFNRAKDLWTKEILNKLIMFPAGLNCRIESADFIQQLEGPILKKQNKHEEHSGIEASAKIHCENGSIKGSDVKIGLKEKYPKIKKLKLEIIDVETTKSLDLKKAIETVRL